MFDRRRLMAAALSLPAVWRVRDALAQSASDAAPSLQRAIDEARLSGRAVMVPAGATPVSRLRITGDAGSSAPGARAGSWRWGRGRCSRSRAQRAFRSRTIAFDGAARAPGGEAGLIEARDVANLTLIDCAVERAQGYGVRLERCGGRVERSSFRGPRAVGAHEPRRDGAHDRRQRQSTTAARTACRSGDRRRATTAPSSGTIAYAASAPTRAATAPTAMRSASFAPTASPVAAMSSARRPSRRSASIRARTP